MAINFSLPQVPFRLSADEMGSPNLMKAINEGTKMGNEPAQLSANLLSTHLQNALNRVKAQYAPQTEEADLAYKKALTQQALRGPAAPAEVATLEWLLKNRDRFNQQAPSANETNETIPEIGETPGSYIQNAFGKKNTEQNSAPQSDLFNKIFEAKMNKLAGIKPAASYAPSNTAKELAEQADAEAGFIPNTGRKQRFPNEQSQQEYLDALSAKTGGLIKGHHFILGENGERIGESHPKSQKERDIDRGTVIFKQFYPLVNEGLNRYSGAHSIENMEKDARNYKTDPAARKRFDQLILAKSLATLTTVNEAARFGAGKQNQVFNQFRKSLSAYDIPAKVDRLITEFQIPAEANIRNGLRFQSELDKADRIYRETAQPNTIEYYPGKAPKTKESSNPDTWGDGEGSIRDPNTGEWSTIPVRAGEWKEFLKDGGKRNE
ncbi:MAG: hypothetical protein EPO02_12785 [Nitrospirae bacterium]|nr:MAG: hypothetical protein EPO02_12785 [Nitrospirota bacterium]